MWVRERYVGMVRRDRRVLWVGDSHGKEKGRLRSDERGISLAALFLLILFRPMEKRLLVLQVRCFMDTFLIALEKVY